MRSIDEIVHDLGNALVPMCELVDTIDDLPRDAVALLGIVDVHLDACKGRVKVSALLDELRGHAFRASNARALGRTEMSALEDIVDT